MYSAERHFVTTAHAQLRLLAADGIMDSTSEQPCFEIAIGKIKQAAGPVKARAVYRAALLCEDVFKRCGSATDTKFRTALARLHSLVGLYADGLFEIDPEFKAVLNGDVPQTIQAIQAPQAIQATQANTAKKSPQHFQNLKAANQNAAALLGPLLRLVKDDSQADALTFLSNFDSRAKTAAKPHYTHVRFDSLMRQVTNHVLGEARSGAKNVSISYAADFETIDTRLAPDIQKLLQAACTEIVRTGLVVTGDLLSSLNRNWQISITGETRGQDLVITLGWRGQGLPGLRENTTKILQRIGGKVKTHAQKQQVQDGAGGTGGTEAQIMILTCPLKAAPKTLPVQADLLPARARKG